MKTRKKVKSKTEIRSQDKEPWKWRTEQNLEVGEQATDDDIIIHPLVSLPYLGQQGNNIISKFRKKLDRYLPGNIKPRYTYKGRKIGTYFPIKDKIKDDHQSNVTYEYTRNREIRNKGDVDYIGETNVRFATRVKEHCSHKQSSIYKHAIRNNYTVSENDFKILNKGYRNSTIRKCLGEGSS